jgi:PrcB C-terminal
MARQHAFPAPAVLLLAAVTCACGSSPVAPDDGEPVPFTRLRPDAPSFTFFSSYVQPARVLVKTQAQLLDLWNAIYQPNPLSLPPPLPAIDFDREMLIVAAMGSRPTGGYVITIEGVFESSRGLTVRVRSISPAPGCGVTLALTQPVDIARVPRRDGSVAFTEQVETRSCNPVEP